MNMTFWDDTIFEPLRRFVDQAMGFLLNNMLAMVVVLLVGVLVAYVVRFMVGVVLRLLRFDHFAERQGLTAVFRSTGIVRPPSAAGARLAYWLVMFLFLIFSLAALDVPALNEMVSRMFLVLPQAIAALVILLAGYLFSVFLQRAVLLGAVNAGVARARLLATAVQTLVLLFTIAVSLEQLGIGRGIVLATFSIAFGSVGLAAALAFGYAARDLARAVLERQLAPPDRPDLGGLSHL
jgi:hypothetical protein